MHKQVEVINTHYCDGNLIWRTVSHRVDEVIPSDHPRHKAASTRRDTEPDIGPEKMWKRLPLRFLS